MSTQQEIFFPSIFTGSALQRIYFISKVRSWFHWHFCRKLKTQNTKEPACLFLSQRDNIYCRDRKELQIFCLFGFFFLLF